MSTLCIHKTNIPSPYSLTRRSFNSSERGGIFCSIFDYFTGEKAAEIKVSFKQLFQGLNREMYFQDLQSEFRAFYVEPPSANNKASSECGSDRVPTDNQYRTSVMAGALKTTAAIERPVLPVPKPFGSIHRRSENPDRQRQQLCFTASLIREPAFPPGAPLLGRIDNLVHRTMPTNYVPLGQQLSLFGRAGFDGFLLDTSPGNYVFVPNNTSLLSHSMSATQSAVPANVNATLLSDQAFTGQHINSEINSSQFSAHNMNLESQRNADNLWSGRNSCPESYSMPRRMSENNRYVNGATHENDDNDCSQSRGSGTVENDDDDDDDDYSQSRGSDTEEYGTIWRNSYNAVSTFGNQIIQNQHVRYPLQEPSNLQGEWPMQNSTNEYANSLNMHILSETLNSNSQLQQNDENDNRPWNCPHVTAYSRNLISEVVSMLPASFKSVADIQQEDFNNTKRNDAQTGNYIPKKTSNRGNLEQRESGKDLNCNSNRFKSYSQKDIQSGLTDHNYSCFSSAAARDSRNRDTYLLSQREITPNMRVESEKLDQNYQTKKCNRLNSRQSPQLLHRPDSGNINKASNRFEILSERSLQTDASICTSKRIETEQIIGLHLENWKNTYNSFKSEKIKSTSLKTEKMYGSSIEEERYGKPKAACGSMENLEQYECLHKPGTSAQKTQQRSRQTEHREVCSRKTADCVSKQRDSSIRQCKGQDGKYGQTCRRDVADCNRKQNSSQRTELLYAGNQTMASAANVSGNTCSRNSGSKCGNDSVPSDCTSDNIEYTRLCGNEGKLDLLRTDVSKKRSKTNSRSVFDMHSLVESDCVPDMEAFVLRNSPGFEDMHKVGNDCTSQAKTWNENDDMTLSEKGSRLEQKNRTEMEMTKLAVSETYTIENMTSTCEHECVVNCQFGVVLENECDRNVCNPYATTRRVAEEFKSIVVKNEGGNYNSKNEGLKITMEKLESNEASRSGNNQIEHIRTSKEQCVFNEIVNSGNQGSNLTPDSHVMRQGSHQMRKEEKELIAETEYFNIRNENQLNDIISRSVIEKADYAVTSSGPRKERNLERKASVGHENKINVTSGSSNENLHSVNNDIDGSMSDLQQNPSLFDNLSYRAWRNRMLFESDPNPSPERPNGPTDDVRTNEVAMSMMSSIISEIRSHSETENESSVYATLQSMNCNRTAEMRFERGHESSLPSASTHLNSPETSEHAPFSSLRQYFDGLLYQFYYETFAWIFITFTQSPRQSRYRSLLLLMSEGLGRDPMVILFSMLAGFLEGSMCSVLEQTSLVGLLLQQIDRERQIWPESVSTMQDLSVLLYIRLNPNTMLERFTELISLAARKIVREDWRSLMVRRYKIKRTN